MLPELLLEPEKDDGNLGSQSQGLFSHDLVVFLNFNFEILMDLAFFGRQSLWVLLDLQYFDGFLSTTKLILGFDLNLDQIMDQSISIFFLPNYTIGP